VYGDDDVHLSSEQLRRSLILIVEEVEEVEVGSSLAQDCGLDTKSIVWSVEVDPGYLGSLHTASKLGCGYSLSALTTETKPSLETWANGVWISIVDSASYKSSEPTVRVSIQLDTTSEGCSQTLTIPHLGSEAELGNNLTIGIHSSSQAGSEAEVTVTSEQTASGSHGSDSSEAASSQRVLESLVLVGDGGLEETGRQEPAVGLGVTGSGGGRGRGWLRRESSVEGDRSWSWSSL